MFPEICHKEILIFVETDDVIYYENKEKHKLLDATNKVDLWIKTRCTFMQLVLKTLKRQDS